MRLSRRTSWLCSVIPAGLLAIVCAAPPAGALRLDRALFDVMARAVPLRSPSTRIVVVDIDEQSLAAVGQWPWSRARVAELVTRIRELGASTVALDVVFAEPERERDGGASSDDVLAKAVSHGGVVLGYAFRFGPDAASLPPCASHALPVAEIRGTDDVGRPLLFEAPGAVCNLPVLTSAAESSGFLNAAPDSDGVLRRIPLLMRSHGRIYPSLALAAVRLEQNGGNAIFRSTNAHASTLTLLDKGAAASVRELALDGSGNMLLRYRGRKGTHRYVSADDVLAGRASASLFDGRIVFVGTTALGNREVVATPLDTLFAGVEVQATAADNLLAGDSLRRPEHATLVELLVLVAVCLTSVLIVRQVGLVLAAIVLALLLVSVWAASLALLSVVGLVVSPLYPTLGVVATLGTMIAAVLSLERRRADRADLDRANFQRVMVESLLQLTEIRDAETGQHSRRIPLYTRLLVEELRHHPAYCTYLTVERMALLSTLSTLHDIGKVGISDHVLSKPGPLTPVEIAEMQKHPTYGRDVILNAQRTAGVDDDATLQLAMAIVFTHHEKWNGGGYPQGLRGEEIPIPGRIIALVDVYDALVAHRPYRRALTHAEATAIIVKGRGTHFDPVVVDAFLAVGSAFARLAQAALESPGADAAHAEGSVAGGRQPDGSTVDRRTSGGSAAA